MNIPHILKYITTIFQKHNARMILVGGCVRDYFLNLPIKDYDIEVYGLNSLAELEKILGMFGKVKLVGKSFGVLKFIHEGREYDFAFPRTERKVAKGHRGFDVSVDGGLDFKTAARRRDFTINAMGYDVLQKRFLDPFGGKEDLQKRILRHIDDSTFIEDPLRLYRGVQFCARFSLTMYPSTKALCQKMVEEGMLEELPKERVFEEIKKLLLQAKTPSLGFALLHELGALRYFPALKELDDLLWRKTMCRVDVLAFQTKDLEEKKRLVLLLAALSLSFDEKGVEAFVTALSDEVKLLEEVLRLWAAYPMALQVYDERTDSAVRKLSVEVGICDLVYLLAADGREEAARWLKERAEALGVCKSAPAPLLLGRDLVEKLKLSPSPKFKEILEKVYQTQLEGKITTKEEALAYVQKEFS